MNKKGFTLVELLAVIVILGIVTSIGIVAIGAVRKSIKMNMFKTKAEFILQAAVSYGEDNGVKDSITVSELINSKYYDTDESCNGELCVTNDVNGDNLNIKTVKIYKNYNRIYSCLIPASWYKPNDEVENDYAKMLVDAGYYCN